MSGPTSGHGTGQGTDQGSQGSRGSRGSHGIGGRARRVLIFVNDTDQAGRHPLFVEIVAEAKRAGLAGATVLRAVEGFGAGQRLHTSRILSLAEGLPMLIVIIDDPARIDAFLPRLDELMDEGMVAVDDVDVVEFVPDEGEASDPVVGR